MDIDFDFPGFGMFVTASTRYRYFIKEITRSYGALD